MNSTADFKRKTRSLIAKNLIIMLVLAVISILAIWSWFSGKKSAEADGMSVKAVSDGVEISWDNKNFYKDLTATSESSVIKGSKGLCKYITGSSQTAQRTKLITGDGLNFFEPYLNRRTGTPFTKDGVWQGSVINDTLGNGENKFVDIDIYFRSSQAKKIYLAGDSKVSPSNINERISEYGNFSTDYIAGASRVAFLNEVNGSNSTNFIWAPNSDYRVSRSGGLYKQILDKEPNEATVTTSNSNCNASEIPEEMLMAPDGKYYYLWLPVQYLSNNQTQFSDYVPHRMEFRNYGEDANKGLYAYDLELSVPSDQGDKAIAFFVSSTSYYVSDLNTLTYTGSDIDFINEYHSSLTKDSKDGTTNPSNGSPFIQIPNDSFGINIGGNTYPSAKMVCTNLTNVGVKVTIGVNTQDLDTSGNNYNYTRAAIVLSYTDANNKKIYDRTGVSSGSNTTKIQYYDMTQYCGMSNPIVLANDTNILTTDNSNFYENAVFSDNEKTRIDAENVRDCMKFKMFSSIQDDAPAYTRVYYFYDAAENKYLVVNSDNTVELTNSGEETAFYWGYKDNFKTPVLQVKDKDLFLVISNGQLKVVNEASASVEELITPFIFEKRGYSFYCDEDGIATYQTSENETYKYYDEEYYKDFSKERTFTQHGTYKNFYYTINTTDGSVKDKLFTSKSTDTESSLPIIGQTGTSKYTPVVTLTKHPTSGYYTGKVTVRVWTEGTDREADIALAGGKYNLKLHFTSATP